MVALEERRELEMTSYAPIVSISIAIIIIAVFEFMIWREKREPRTAK